MRNEPSMMGGERRQETRETEIDRERERDFFKTYVHVPPEHSAMVPSTSITGTRDTNSSALLLNLLLFESKSSALPFVCFGNDLQYSRVACRCIITPPLLLNRDVVTTPLRLYLVNNDEQDFNMMVLFL